jgi:hypothetical protein
MNSAVIKDLMIMQGYIYPVCLMISNWKDGIHTAGYQDLYTTSAIWRKSIPSSVETESVTSAAV